MQRYIIIHYGEIYLKGDNRKFFENILISNINKALADFTPIWLKHVAGRILIRIEEGWDLKKIEENLKRVFGVEYFTFAWKSKQDINQIEKDLSQLVKEKKFKTFRITTRRTNKKFPLRSK